jgi:hypothetical protein
VEVIERDSLPSNVASTLVVLEPTISAAEALRNPAEISDLDNFDNQTLIFVIFVTSTEASSLDKHT